MELLLSPNFLGIAISSYRQRYAYLQLSSIARKSSKVDNDCDTKSIKNVESGNDTCLHLLARE